MRGDMLTAREMIAAVEEGKTITILRRHAQTFLDELANHDISCVVHLEFKGPVVVISKERKDE